MHKQENPEVHYDDVTIRLCGNVKIGCACNILCVFTIFLFLLVYHLLFIDNAHTFKNKFN